MDRRTLLSSLTGGLTITLTGCVAMGGKTDPDGDVGTSPTAELELSPASDVEIAKRVSYRINLEHRTSERNLAADLIANGSKRISGTNNPAPQNRPFVFNGSVYEFSYAIVDSLPATTFHLTLTDLERTATEHGTMRYADLSTRDKTVLERFGWDDGGPFKVQGVPVVYTEDEISASSLVPTPEKPIVEWDSASAARITVEKFRETPVKTYEYTTHVVHESAKEFGRQVRENNEFALEGLTDEQEMIVTKAINDEHGYEVAEGEPPEAFYGLVDRFSRGEEVSRPWVDTREETVSGTYVVRWDSQTYLADLAAPEDLQSSPEGE